MKIKQKSMEVLEKLYNTLINTDTAHLTITININQFVNNMNITSIEFNRCLCYLKSAGYINCTIDYPIKDETKTISLTASAIDVFETIN